MKNFLKLLVSIIVICTIGYTIYFLLSNSSKYNSSNESGDLANTELENSNQNDEKDNQEVENIENDKNLENNNITDNSGEVLSEEEKINKIVANIDMLRKQNNSTSVSKTLEDNVGIDIVGTKYQDFFTHFAMMEAFTTVQVAGSMVYIIPASDFLDLAQYHYDENGNLLLYVDELIGVGGEIRYYFSDNNLLTTQYQVEENIPIDYEDSQEIIQRAKVIYDKYMK